MPLLEDYTDEELKEELERREKERLPILRFTPQIDWTDQDISPVDTNRIYKCHMNKDLKGEWVKYRDVVILFKEEKYGIEKASVVPTSDMVGNVAFDSKPLGDAWGDVYFDE